MSVLHDDQIPNAWMLLQVPRIGRGHMAAIQGTRTFTGLNINTTASSPTQTGLLSTTSLFCATKNMLWVTATSRRLALLQA